MTIHEHYVKAGGKQDYRTPLDLARDVRLMWGSIELDPCCTVNNLRATHFYTEKDDGLLLPWVDATWCNPPYEQMRDWLLKATHEAAFGHRIGFLMSVARTNQDYYQAALSQASCLQLLNEKLKHNEGKQAMLASQVLWFNCDPDEVCHHVGDRGIVLVPK